ncbi:restriction endonuclease subunit S [Mycoplasmopsis arginini]|uniref:restriction endonuclease subunit S n=1 Tax=Mycoplasmopsis arginini TaxID=2094 RepID=UPI00249D96A7|nr:restriction endonuclease subunit S [Mycoplasmopsis arginini]MDI3348488.1 hypothetical protein [Mycoplasmopsis arginini]
MERKLEFEYIKIKDLFIQKTGKYYSKQFIENNKGKYPIYSSQTENDGIYGYINTYCLDGEFITYTTRGKYAGTVFYRSGKFSTTSNCAYLVVKNNNKKINIKL